MVLAGANVVSGGVTYALGRRIKDENEKGVWKFWF
jgi:hypothetical protein